MIRTARTTIFILLTLTSSLSSAQSYELSKINSAAVKGTSSLHDWEMDLNSANTSFSLVREGNTIKSIRNVTFTCNARNLKSESSMMDKKAWDALKSKEFPEITFTGSSVTDLAMDGDRFTGKLNGKLRLAGQTRDVTLPFKGVFSDSRTINIESSADLTFSTFNIEPPTAMLGTLKTGDKITLNFNLQYVQK